MRGNGSFQADMVHIEDHGFILEGAIIRNPLKLSGVSKK
jgi:hypothetical protein